MTSRAKIGADERRMFREHSLRVFARSFAARSLAGLVASATGTATCLAQSATWGRPAAVTGGVLCLAQLGAYSQRKRWLARPELAPWYSVGVGMVVATGVGVSTGLGDGLGSWGGATLVLFWLYAAVAIGLPPRALLVAMVTQVLSFSIPAAAIHGPDGLGPFLVTLFVGGTATFGTARLRESMDLRHFVATARWKRTVGAIETMNRELEVANQELEMIVDEQLRTVLARRRDVQRLHRMIHSPDGERPAEIAVALERSLLADTSSRYEPGTVLGGRARILRAIGGGGFGDVYLAQDLASREHVAIKVLRPSKQASRGQLKRFFLEAAAAAAIRHPAIVRVLHVDVDTRGAPYLISEHIEGCSLRDVVERGPIDPDVAVAITSVLVDALVAVHGAGLVHRDIKPDNILLSEAKPGVKLLDFGVSQWLSESFEITSAGELVGSVGYMPPERFEQEAPRAFGAAADVFAVGMLLFELINGGHPFGGLGTLALVTRMSRAEFPRLIERVPTVSRELSDFVAALLARDASARPDIGAVAAGLSVLRAALGSEPAESAATHLLAQIAQERGTKAARSVLPTGAGSIAPTG